MNKKYFKDFEWIKEVQDAKSLSFASSEKNASFSLKLKQEFLNILNNFESRFRISLHTSSKDDLHNMIIGIQKDNFVYPHRHQKSESYHIIEGKMALIYFYDNGDIDNILILDSNDILVARVDKDVYHASIALTDTIYHETRIGPFISQGDSEFAEWISEDKDSYMRSIMKNIKG